MKPNHDHLQKVALLEKKVKDLRAACKRRSWLAEYEELKSVRAIRATRNEPLNESEYWLAAARSKAYNIAKSLPSSGYSMGEVKEVSLPDHLYFASHNKRSSYAGRFKGRETYGLVAVSYSWVELYNTREVGGIWTTLTNKLGPREYECFWFEGRGQKQHFKLIKVKGWLIKGYHVAKDDRFKSAEQAREYVRGRRMASANTLKSSRINESLQNRAADIPLNRIFVSVEDSRAGGNCEPGTARFADANKIDLSKIGAVRADWLLQHAGESLVNVNRAIFAARIRYAKTIVTA
ncbi:hypothetical protein GCM10027051_31390 [Niabella terrae]